MHRKASRLAVLLLGDFGRHPIAVGAIAHCLCYKLCLSSKPSNSLLSNTLADMNQMAQRRVDCWLGRVNKMADLLDTNRANCCKTSGHILLKCVQSPFERFWLDEIKSSRLGPDGLHHNKLHKYSSVKCN